MTARTRRASSTFLRRVIRAGTRRSGAASRARIRAISDTVGSAEPPQPREVHAVADRPRWPPVRSGRSPASSSRRAAGDGHVRRSRPGGPEQVPRRARVEGRPVGGVCPGQVVMPQDQSRVAGSPGHRAERRGQRQVQPERADVVGDRRRRPRRALPAGRDAMVPTVTAKSSGTSPLSSVPWSRSMTWVAGVQQRQPHERHARVRRPAAPGDDTDLVTGVGHQHRMPGEHPLHATDHRRRRVVDQRDRQRRIRAAGMRGHRRSAEALRQERRQPALEDGEREVPRGPARS